MSGISKETLTATEAASLLGVSEAAIRKRIKQGSLSAQKEGNTWSIKKEEVERLREESNHSRTSTPNRTEPNPESSDEKVEILKAKLAAFERENEELRKHIEHLQTQNERLTLLLANEQAHRLKALPRPLSWIARLLGRRRDQ